jgi:hypothetical protein
MTHCDRDTEVVQAVLSGRWPEGCDDSLREHAATCDVCGEVAEIASALARDRAALRRDIVVPAAGQVWWRAAVRARLEATQAAARPMTWLYTVAALLLGTVAVLALALSADRASGLIDGLASWVELRAQDAAPVATTLVELVLQRGFPLLIALGFCLLAAPIALYFALHDE